MNDQPDRTPGPDDPLAARLRRGLDRLTDDIGAEPPGLSDVPVTTATGGVGRRWPARAAAAALVALVAGTAVVIATRDGGDGEPEIASLDSATAVATDATVTAGPESGGPDQLNRAVATVLDDGREGPQLCLGAIMESFPPQCSGLDITNWEWDRALSFERASGVRWGEFVVVGMYDRDGQTFTLTRPARSAQPDDYTRGPNVDFSTPCEAPEGGWPEATNQELSDAAQRIDTGRAGPRGDDMSTTRARHAIEGFAGLWIGSNPNVLNVRVVGDLDAADATIRNVFDGPLCLIPSTYTLDELQDIQNSVDLGSNPVFSASYVDVEANIAVFETNAPDAELEADIAERFGDAAEVRVTGLVPIAPGEDPDPGPGTTPGTAGPASPAPATVPPTTLDPDTPVSSPPVRNGFERLEIELIVPDTTVRSGRVLTAQLHVSNRSGETVTDPGCVLGSGPFALVPADNPSSELWQQYVIDCSGPFKIPDGYEDEHSSFDFRASTKTGEPLPPGEYRAAMEIEGYGRIEVPVTVTG